MIDDCLVVLWLVDPACSDDDVDDDDEDDDEEVLVLAIAPEAAVEGFSASLFGELALELSDEDGEGPLSEAVEGLLHGLLEGLEFSLEAALEADVSWDDELGRNLGYGLCHSKRPSRGRSLSKSKFHRFLES